MRTTLSIDDDVLVATKGLAASQRRTVGEVVSSLVRQALQPTLAVSSHRNGVPLLARKIAASNVTLDLVNRLRDDSIRSSSMTPETTGSLTY